jgi:hypothetical protein
MKHLLQFEELVQTLAGIIILALLPLHFSWWLWPFLFLSPDISFIAYTVNKKVGAWAYNILHHKGVATGLAITGYFLHDNVLTFIGVLLFTHSSFDRLLGYGLKYTDSFKHTHLDTLKSN